MAIFRSILAVSHIPKALVYNSNINLFRSFNWKIEKPAPNVHNPYEAHSLYDISLAFELEEAKKLDWLKKLATIDKTVFDNYSSDQYSLICKVLYTNFNPYNKSIARAIAYLEESLSKNLKHQPLDEDLNNVIIRLKNIRKAGYVSNNWRLEESLLEKVSSINKPLDVSNLLTNMIDLIGNSISSGKYAKIFINLAGKISHENLQSVTYQNILQLTNAYTKVYLCVRASYRIADDIDIFDALETEITRRISHENNSHFSAREVLYLYSKMKKFKPEFFKLLVDHYLSRSSEIENRELFSMSKTVYLSIADNLDPVYLEILEQFYVVILDQIGKIDLKSLSLSIHYVRYADARLLDKLEQLIECPRYQNSSEEVKSNFNISVLAFLTNRFEKITEKLHEKLLNVELSQLSFVSLSRLANFYSAYDIENPAFWDYFMAKLPTIVRNQKGFLYSIYLNLSGKPRFEAYKSEISSSLSEIEFHWKSARELEFDTTTTTRVSDFVGDFLKNNCIEHKTKFYDDYIIDFAIPDKKIGFIILKTNDYALPDKRIVMVRQKSIKYLQNSGWKIAILSQFEENFDEITEIIVNALD